MVRLLRVGFETRITVRPISSLAAGRPEIAAPGEDDDITVVLTRAHARELDLDTGTKVWLAANRGSTRFPAADAV